MKLFTTTAVALTLLAAPAFAQSEETVPSPNQRALQKPNSSDPATTVPDSSSGGASSGEAGDDDYVDPKDPALVEPDDDDPKASDPDKPKD